MSDFNSSLPIRTETNGDVAAKIVDGTVPSQALNVDASGRVTTKNADGAGNALTSQVNGAQRALDVGVNVAGVQVDPRAIRALTSADVVTAAQGAPNTAANAWPTKLTDGTNTTAVKAASTAAVASDPSAVVALSPNSPLPTGTNTIGAVNLKDGAGNSITSSTAGATRPLDVALRDGAGALYSATNPVPVTLTVDSTGIEIDSYNTVAAVAAAATSNHDYTVTALKTLLLTQIEAAASGKMKIEVQIETAAASGVFNTRFVQFNSTSSPNLTIHLDAPIAVVAGARVRIIRTNKDLLPQDVYSTICGQEV